MHEWEGDERKDGLLRYSKNKDNKSADHEGMTQLIAEKKNERKEHRQWGRQLNDTDKN